MKRKLEQWMDDIFFEELTNLPPESVNRKKLKEDVLRKLHLTEPSSLKKSLEILPKTPKIIEEKPRKFPEQISKKPLETALEISELEKTLKIIELPKKKTRKAYRRRLMIAGVMVLLILSGGITLEQVSSFLKSKWNGPENSATQWSEPLEFPVEELLPEVSGSPEPDTVESEPVESEPEESEPEELCESRIESEEAPALSEEEIWRLDRETKGYSPDQRMSFGGVTITLDYVTLDDNFLDLSFTAAYEQPIFITEAYPESYLQEAYPLNYRETQELYAFLPAFFVGINEVPDSDENALFESTVDAAVLDEQTIQVYSRYAIPQMIPDRSTIHLLAYYVQDAQGTVILEKNSKDPQEDPFHFKVTIDKSPFRAVSKSVSAGVYPFQTQNGAESLRIHKLMLSPLGTLLYYSGYPERPTFDPNEVPGNAIHTRELYIEDDLGNVADILQPALNGSKSVQGGDLAELLNLSPEAKTLTITPIVWSETSEEKRYYPVEDIVGQQIPLNPFGGCIVREYTVEDSSVTFLLEPYGRSHLGDGNLGLYLDDTLIPFTDQHNGVIQKHYDRETACYQYRISYDTATREDLEQIQSFHVFYQPDLTLDSEQAVTLPLT